MAKRPDRTGTFIIVAVWCLIASAVLAFAVVAFWGDLSPEDTRHAHFVRALWPSYGEPGKLLRFKREPAVLYRDPDRPLTWHVCTATQCGRYYEDETDAERSK